MSYLQLEEQIKKTIVDSKQDSDLLRKEITDIIFTFFECNRVIYCSSNQIIKHPDEKLSAYEKEDIKEWFDLLKERNNTEIIHVENSNNGLFKISKNLGSAVLVPLSAYNHESIKKFCSYFALGYKQNGKVFTSTEIDYLDRLSVLLRDPISSIDYKALKNWSPADRKHFKNYSHLKSLP